MGADQHGCFDREPCEIRERNSKSFSRISRLRILGGKFVVTPALSLALSLGGEIPRPAQSRDLRPGTGPPAKWGRRLACPSRHRRPPARADALADARPAFGFTGREQSAHVSDCLIDRPANPDAGFSEARGTFLPLLGGEG